MQSSSPVANATRVVDKGAEVARPVARRGKFGAVTESVQAEPIAKPRTEWGPTEAELLSGYAQAVRS